MRSSRSRSGEGWMNDPDQVATPQHGAHCHHHGSAATGDDAVRVTDPVCGMKVDPATSKHRFDHGGQTFHFCSAGCRTKFAADPAKYLAPPAPASVPAMVAHKSAIHTCPMHPEIRQQGPGS